MNWYFFILFCAFFPMQNIMADTIRKDYLVMSGDAKRRAEREIYEKFGLRTVSSGGGAITVLRLDDLGVETDFPFTIQEGRRLLVACSGILLKHLNGYRQLRPFLFEFPFPIERIGFSIYISAEGKKKISQEAIRIFNLSSGKLTYDILSNNSDSPVPFCQIHEETYQEALQILAKEDRSLQLPKNPLSPEEVTKGLAEIDKAISEISRFVQEGEAVSNMPRYVGPQVERDMSWELDRYGLHIAKKYEMEFHRADRFSDDREETYSLMFINFHQLTFQQGQEFARTLVKDFLRELQTNPVVRHYHEYYNEGNKRMRYPPLITDNPVPEQMGVKITFWDKNFDRPKKPYLAEIVFLCGDFYYYDANPETQARQLILKESFSDAMGVSKRVGK